MLRCRSINQDLLDKWIIINWGKELDYHRSLASYGIKNGDTIHMYDKQAIGYGSDMRIFVTRLGGSYTINLKVEPSEIIGRFKTRLVREMGEYFNEIVLIFSGVEL